MARARTFLPLLCAAALALLLLATGAAALGGGKKRNHGRRSSGENGKRGRVCSGSSCAAMSDLLPALAFAEGEGPVVECSCEQFKAGSCFAPGCFPCDKSCFDEGTAEGRKLAKAGGPFGTGLLCSSGCLPCCQAPDDAGLFEGSTCALPQGGCDEGAA